MALKLAGEEIGIQEKIETIVYCPGLQDTADLEAATETITATSEASGVANADYSKALTLPKPDDARLVVKRIAARLQVTRNSGTSSNLYCRVYVDVQNAAHRLFDVDIQANSLSATDLTSGTIFDLLSDGAEHTFYFFFWVDSGDSVISLVQLWEGVGTCSTSDKEVLRLTHSGFISLTHRWHVQGTGNLGATIQPTSQTAGQHKLADYINKNVWGYIQSLLIDNIFWDLYGTVATDLTYLYELTLRLRSQQ